MISELNDRKALDYAGEGDIFSDFREDAEHIGTTPEKVLFTHWSKHWRAITAYVREGDTKSEPVESRVHDMINYGFLMLGLIAERRAREAEAFRRNEHRSERDELSGGRFED